MIKLIASKNGTINFEDMLDGQIGIIVEWNTQTEPIGSLVQRYGDSLVKLGFTSDCSWENIFKKKFSCI